LTIRVSHLITDLDTGGAERSLVNLVSGLDRTRFESDVITLIEPGPMAQPLAEAGIPVTSLGMSRGRPNMASIISLVRHVRRMRPVILQTWLYHADLVGTVAAWFARPERLVWNLRCTDITQVPGDRSIGWIVRALALLSNQPDAIVVNSKRGRLFHSAAGYRPKLWVDMPNGVDVERFRPRRAEQASLRAKLGLDPQAKVVGLVARYHPMKDCQTFLRAAAHFSQGQDDARFLLCGEGLGRDNEVLRQLIENLGLGGRVILLGRRADPENVYPALDVLALPSIYGEGFPNVLIEAMACGVPCVATDVGDSADILGELGMIVPSRDAAALAQGWRTMFGRQAQGIGELVRGRVLAQYDLNRMRSRYEDLYESLALGVSRRGSA
jgi:glycosyltransferase involved in cell wall biosynthesis